MRDGVMRLERLMPRAGSSRRSRSKTRFERLFCIDSFRLRRCLDDADAIIFNHIKHA